MPRHAPGRVEDAGLLHAVIRHAGPPGWAYLVVPGSRAPLQIFFAEHIQVAERQRAIADPGQNAANSPVSGRPEFSMPCSYEANSTMSR